MSRFSIDRLSVLKKNNAGRMSMLLNEDDYDYALELRPDDEYRQAAEALPKLVDFDDIDLTEVCKDIDRSTEQRENANIQPFSSFNDPVANNRRTSNFDQSMMELHTGKYRKSSIRPSMGQNRRSSTGNDEGLSQWDAVDGTNERSVPYDPAESLEDLEACNFEPSDDDEEEEQKYDRRITGIGTGGATNDAVDGGLGINFNATGGSSASAGSTFSSRWQRLSRKEFSFRINLLEKHRKWVERAARRSSIGFHRHHPSSDKEAMDKFLVAMAGGVHVRRHQGYRLSEVVRLYSVTGCRTIEWDKPKAKDLLAQRRKQGIHTEGGTSAVFNTSYDKSAFDCCIAICGCGDDLNAGHDPHSQHDAPNMNADNTEEDVRYVNFGRAFYNLGYRRRGTFRDLDVLAVHPAGKEDPTMVGMLGTECLRRTKDAFNAELTFSVVVRDTTSSSGYSTLDIECETADMYYLLLRGFRLLQEEAEAHRAQQRNSAALSSRTSGADGESDFDLEAGDRTSSKSFSTASLLHAQRIEELSAVWNSVKGYVTGGAWEQKAPVLDPISELFAPSSQLDPLRALRVGGGLLPANSTHKHAPSGVLNSPTSPQSPSLLQHANSVQTNSLPIAQFLGWNSAGTQIWARLKMAGLDVKCVLSWDLKRVILKIRCPPWRLEQMAEQMHLKLKSRDGYLKQFKVARRDTFVAMGDKGAMFRSSERQQIIDYIIRSKIKDGGAELDEKTELGKEIVQRFPLHMYSKLADIRHAWVTFWKRESFGQDATSWSPFTESYAVTYAHLKSGAEFFFANLLTQPLDSIAEYFGENIAFYFAYMAFYTRWLVFPSILGVIVFAFQMHENRLDHWLCPIYAVVVMVWACFMLAFWRQKSSALAHRWGVLDYEVEETERPQFRGKYTYDESSGEVRKTYSLWKRTAKYFVSIPVLACAILATLVIMTTVFYSQDQMYNDFLNGEPVDFRPKFPTFAPHHSSPQANITDFGATAGNSTSTDTPVGASFSLSEIRNSSFWAATFFYPCMYGIVVSLLTIVFEFIALWLNDYENHRTQTTYMNRLILKVFSFQFVTIFTSLFYYAFFMSDHEGAFFQISVTVFSLMTVGQWWSMFLDIVVPSLYHRALLYRMRSAFANTNRKIYRAREYTDEKIHRAEASGGRVRNVARSLTAVMNEKLDKRSEFLEQAKSKCWEEALQARYNNFADYTSMVIQIGFVLFFSAVFPLCPLLALLNNLLLIRFNALKICYTRQRPIAQKIGGIGVWEDVLQIMSVGGILTNCALYGFTSSQLKNIFIPSIGKTGMAILLFAYEHTILLFKYWLHSSIPTVHPSVQRARTRERKSSDRKSLLRSQATKTRRRSTLVPTTGGAGKGDGGDGAGGAGAGPAKKKPLRAQSSMLGYWFDLSTGGAQAGGENGGVEMTHRTGVHNQNGAEQEGLLPRHAARTSTAYAGPSAGEAEYKSDSEEDDQDLPPAEQDMYNQYSAQSMARDVLLEEDSLPGASQDGEDAAQYAQPFVAQALRSHTPSPVNARQRESAAALAGRRSVSPTRPTPKEPATRRSLSPTRSRSASPTPVFQPAPMPATREEMIEMIRANISNNLMAPPAALPHLVPTHPVHAPAPLPAASRRVSFAGENVVTTQPQAPVEDDYEESGSEQDQEDEQDAEFSDYDVSDLSDEDDDGDDWEQGHDSRYDNLAPLSAGRHHEHAAAYHTPPKADAWRMSFTHDSSEKLNQLPGQSQKSSAKYSPLQGGQAAPRSAKSQRSKDASGKQSSAKKVVVPAPPVQISASSNVQEMLTNWFWPSAAKKPASEKTAQTARRHGSLNIAPLGKGKGATLATNKNTKIETKTPSFAPASPPPSTKARLQDVTSPYAALLTPPIVIAPLPVADTPTTQRVAQAAAAGGIPRDTSPRRATPGTSPLPKRDSAAPKPRNTSPRGLATPPPMMTPQQITSPFSYTGYTPDVPAKAGLSAAACKENDRILANLQTGQLQQLLLLQQQQQQELMERSPAAGGKRKLVVSSASGVPCPVGEGSAPASATNSPARSALAGSRKKLLQQQTPQLGWQESPNPYLHLISPSEAQRGASPPRASLATPLPRPLDLGDHRPSASSPRAQRRSVLMSPAAAETNTPRRRAQGSTGRRGKPTSQAPTTPAAEQSQQMLGAPAPNPFSFAAQKRPERVMYD